MTLANDFKEGDEVFGLAYGGAYAEYIAVSVKMIVHRPMELSWEVAAGIPEVWFTAIQACFLVGNLSAGQTVLFHAGASGLKHRPSNPDNSCQPVYDPIGESGGREMHSCDRWKR